VNSFSAIETAGFDAFDCNVKVELVALAPVAAQAAVEPIRATVAIAAKRVRCNFFIDFFLLLKF
jgi:hypothetical protein